MAQKSCYTLLESISLQDSFLKAGGESKVLPRQLGSSASQHFRDLQGCFHKNDTFTALGHSISTQLHHLITLQADDLLKQADDLLAQMAQGHFQKSTASQDAQLHSSTEHGPGFQVQCDVNGCIIVPVAQEEAAGKQAIASIPASKRYLCGVVIKAHTSMLCEVSRPEGRTACQQQEALLKQ